MTDSKEELRPCPFHGLQSEVKSWPGDEEMKILPQFGCEMVGCFAAHGKTIKEAAANWNSAYCWKLLDESRERERKLIEAEHKLSDAYLRIRKLVSAWQTPIAPTPEQIYELTENKIKELIKACAN